MTSSSPPPPLSRRWPCVCDSIPTAPPSRSPEPRRRRRACSAVSRCSSASDRLSGWQALSCRKERGRLSSATAMSYAFRGLPRRCGQPQLQVAPRTTAHRSALCLRLRDPLSACSRPPWHHWPRPASPKPRLASVKARQASPSLGQVFASTRCSMSGRLAARLCDWRRRQRADGIVNHACWAEGGRAGGAQR